MRRAMSEFEGKAENICSHRVLLSLTHKSHCGHRAKGVPSQLPQEREGHEQFIEVFTADLQGSPLQPVFLEAGRAVKSTGGSV